MTYILVAPNGARRGKADHPELPISTDEIIATAGDCHAAGAHGLHLHIRDEEGRHSLDPGQYLETLAALSAEIPTLDLQITTESAGVFDVPDQLLCLEKVKPSWASISIREIAREPALADRVYGTCAANGTRVQHILYGADDARLLANWRADGVVRAEQDECIFVLGRYATGEVASLSELDIFLQQGTPSSPWMVCAFGPTEHACLIEAARRGGNVRVGFENGMLDANGTVWPNNAASVSALISAPKGINS